MVKILKFALPALLAVLLIILVIIFIFIIKPNSDIDKNRQALTVSDAQQSTGGDKIHFLSTGSSDAILLESNGHFALIDCAEDTDNPRELPDLELEGYEQKVLDYLRKNASDKNGIIYLDFVLGTHSHSDHIGGFDTIILDHNVRIGRAYLKKYNEDKINAGEIRDWDNKEVYNQMVDALNKRAIPIIWDIKEPEFTLGNFDIKLYNTEYETGEGTVGENDNSLGVLVEKNGKRVFLAGDIDNYTGDEDKIGENLGKIDVLKVGHHSYSHSTTTKWLKNLDPEICVVTNDYEKTDKRTLRRISRVSKSPILVTGRENGVIIELGDDGETRCYNNIH